MWVYSRARRRWARRGGTGVGAAAALIDKHKTRDGEPARQARCRAAMRRSVDKAIAAWSSHLTWLSRASALVLGAALGYAAISALATLPATAPASAHPLASNGLRGRVATRVPIGLAAAASARLGASHHGFWPVRRGQALVTRGAGIGGTFTASGPRLRVAQGTLGLSFQGVGRGARLQGVPAAAPAPVTNEVLYTHGRVSEFYRNGPNGLEQGFTVPRRPRGGGGSLVLSQGIEGSLIPRKSRGRILFRTQAGASALEYGQLSALDARGRLLPAVMAVRDGTIQLRIDDRGARYPVRIDPFIQQGGKLTASGETGFGRFGERVALSSDGNTALIGGPADNTMVGAAWVFTRSGSTWTQQGAKLTGTGEIGAGGFGESVALSSDGNTALIGGEHDNTNVGAAWVVTRSGSTWTQQGEKLTGAGEGGEGRFGRSVALGSEGHTAPIGGERDHAGVGAAWVFTRSGTTWTQQGEKLTGGGEVGAGGVGESVALSSDGNTALIGGPSDNAIVGAAWVFTRSGSTWTQQGAKLTGTGEGGQARFGHSPSLSSDGNTALIGGQADNGMVGAAWAFTRSGSTWTQQGAKLTGAEEIGQARFGGGVALSSDGNIALIGGPNDNTVGAASTLSGSGAPCTQHSANLTGPAP